MEPWEQEWAGKMIKPLKNDAGRESVKEAQKTLHTYRGTRFVVSLPSEYYAPESAAKSNQPGDKIIRQNRLRQQVRIDKLVEALKQAGEWFGEYAEAHEKEGDTEKRMRNIERQAFCIEAIAKIEETGNG
jgi:hypothetical protein